MISMIAIPFHVTEEEALRLGDAMFRRVCARGALRPLAHPRTQRFSFATRRRQVRLNRGVFCDHRRGEERGNLGVGRAALACSHVARG